MTLKSTLEHVMLDTEQAPPGFAQYPAVAGYRAALTSMMRNTELADKLLKRGPSSQALQWAGDDSLSDDDQCGG